MIWGAIGAALMALGVMLGAFGAHALKERLDAYSMDVYQKAVFYHFIHALGILIVARTGGLTQSACTTICALLLAGIVLFSGSLYLLAITGTKALGAITPFGGLSFIAAWLLLAYHLLRAK
ncbi:MAG TPA: DUF423 domain-containing protein [Bryobacteraceae bacterium]|jgi:uncharacterized membrane protein YgdD (TMEM256/DUF423 family)|nr:DUF423 domain-containing protein [Bryobacteraceae bacterium]